MTHVQDLLDRLTQLVSDKQPWSKFFFDVARYTLPDAERFDPAFATPITAINAVLTTSVVGGPIAVERGREIYNQTSLYAVDRGANGTLSLITPQRFTWHELESDDPYGAEADDEQTRWYERLRDYLFRTRENPRSGFWTMQKANMRSTWAFGTALAFIEESNRGSTAPFSYRSVPISESHLGCDFEGTVNTNFRLFRRSAEQCFGKWGMMVSPKVYGMAMDPKRKDQTIQILHAVYPRNGDRGAKAGYSSGGEYGASNGRTGDVANYDGGSDVRSSEFSSCYVEVDEKHLIGEGGFYEFPFRIDHWQRNNPGPYAEGPVAIALADIKSLNMMSKNELRAMQLHTSPPLATSGEADSANRLNLNANAINPGYVNNSGQMLVQPINAVQRPDLARAVIEAREKGIGSSLYLDLWQSLIDARPGETATAALIRNQEKGDILGPVGSTMQVGLSFQVEREINILERSHAFEPGMPLEAPPSAQGKGVGVRFTAPIDKMRRLPELQGTEHLIVIGGQLAQAGKPEALDKLDADAIMDEAQDVLGAPRKIMTKDAVLKSIRAAREKQLTAQQGIAATDAAGVAAQNAAAGADAVSKSPAATRILQNVAGLAGIPG